MEENASIREKLENEIQQRGFIAPGLLPQLCSVQDIRLHLSLDILDQRPQKIFNTALKLFSILVLLDQPSVILSCLEGNLNDRSVFNYDPAKPFCSESRLKGTVLEPFANVLFMQWSFPPRISRDEHHEFPPEFLKVLPPILGDRERRIASGAYGQIYTYTFPRGQLEAYAQEGIVAVKYIAQKVDTSRQDLRREVKIMRQFRHPALMPLLASFEVQEKGKPLEHAMLYLVMPFAAGGDMEHWIHEKSRPSFLRSYSRHEIQTYLFAQIQFLYDGLAFLHKENGQSIVLHFDLRPPNLLLFMDNSSPVWKISDFGIAQMARTDETRRTHADHNYAPPEVDNKLGLPANRLHGREFDVYSMACIALQLVILACQGWEDGAIEKFDSRRQGKTEDKSFRNNHDVVMSCVAHLRQEHAQHVALAPLLDLIEESLDPDPERRPMAWEIPVYLLLVTSQELPYQALGQTVPQATMHESAAIPGPVNRAERRGRLDLANFLLQRGWSHPSLLRPRLQRHDSDVDPSQYLSNLPANFAGKLKGKAGKIIVDMIDNAFTQNLETRFVGLWGLGGMGKSHIVYTYAHQFRKKTHGTEPHHTFWINASDESKLNLSCQEIKTKVGSRDDPDLLLSIKQWLEDDSNGPWILILDGLDDIAYASKLFPKLPRAKRGRAVITTRNRDVLLRFTGLKSQATIQVKDLPIEDARKIFDDIIEGCDSVDQPPTDQQFRELFRLVHTPLFIKWAAEYIIRPPGGPTKIGELIEDLKENVGYVSLLDFANEEPMSEEHLYQIFSCFLHPFANRYDVSSESFVLLGTLACFSSDDLSFEAFKGFCKTAVEARLYLGDYMSYSFISSQSPSTPGQLDYKMHDLISEFILRYIAQVSHSEKKTMECFGWMLDRIYRMYLDLKRGKYQAEDSRIRRDSFMWKRPFLPHFEEFSKYVHRLKRDNGVEWQIDGWKCKPFTAQSIITFTQAFASSNRIDDAIQLLQFVLDHGIESNKKDEQGYAKEVIIDTLNNLASRFEEKRPGRNMKGFLEKALEYARNGLKMAKEVDSPSKIWRLSLQVTRILGRLDRFTEAAEQMKLYRRDLEKLWSRLCETDKTKAELDRDMLLAHLLLQCACAKRKKPLLIKSREILICLIDTVQATMALEESILDELKLRLAAVHSEMPKKDLLAHAQATYAASLERRRVRFGDEHTYPQIVDAKLNLAIVWIRQDKAADAARTLRPIFDELIIRYGEHDESTRRVAYTLVDAYTGCEDQVAADEIKSSFKNRALNRTSGGGCFFNLDGDNNQVDDWPSKPLGTNRHFGVRPLLIRSSEDLLLEGERDDTESVE